MFFAIFIDPIRKFYVGSFYISSAILQLCSNFEVSCSRKWKKIFFVHIDSVASLKFDFGDGFYLVAYVLSFQDKILPTAI